MGETNQEPILFSEIEYFRLLARVAEAARETRASYIRLEEDYAMGQRIIEEKKDFKFFQNN